MRLCERCESNPAIHDDDWCDECILEVETILAEVEEPNGNDPDPVRATQAFLERKVAAYELEYGISSHILSSLEENGLTPIDLPERDRELWLGFYRELLEWQ